MDHLLINSVYAYYQEEEGTGMEVTAVAQVRRMVLEHLSRYTWNDVLIDHVYDILQEVREDTPRYRCCVYKERAVLKNRIDMALGQECKENIIEASKNTLFEPERKDLPIIDNGTLVERKADLRAFVISSGAGTKVWKSGLTRFSRNPDSFVVNSSQGGGFKDTWVME